MKIKKMFLNVMLSVIYGICKLIPINNNKITFISLESNTLKDDLKLIYDGLDKEKYIIKLILTLYDKKSIINDFKYMLNTFIQTYHINTSKLVIINDNNYVVTKFKKNKVKVIQVWHANGAIKKFGNAIKRTYRINNYDYVISNSDYWIKPYNDAFNPKSVEVIGMPRIDNLLNEEVNKEEIKRIYSMYPNIKEKKIILYAPTFRGNVVKGMTNIPFDFNNILNNLKEDYLILYKSHPLIPGIRCDDKRVINVDKEPLYPLLIISDILISDYSSIIFDYSLLDKPLYLYTPDIKEYTKEIGLFVDIEDIFKEVLCINDDELIEKINNKKVINNNVIKDTFFKYKDTNNTKRNIELIKKIMNN